MERLKTIPVKVGDDLVIGGNAPVVIQTMCNTHTSDVDASVAQCIELYEAGAELIRLTVPGQAEVKALKEIKSRLIEQGCRVPLVADIHFSAQTAIECVSIVEKVRINPGNFHPDHITARARFSELITNCKKYGTAVRIGVNHGSLGKYITEQYGNTPHGMAKAAMEWIDMCIDEGFYNVVVSLKSSNTVVMVAAYRELVVMMKERGVIFPLHIGLTEAGGGISGRIKSCVALGALLRDGIGDTIRVSLTESPVNEIPVARYIAGYPSFSGDDVLDAALRWGPDLIDRKIDRIPESAGISQYLRNEIMQASRRRFYKPEYIACPGCGRTMYDLQGAFAQVQERTSHLKNIVIAVMGCIVNGPGEMADADWGYVGEGGGKVSIYRAGEPVLRHIPDTEAIDRLLELIESNPIQRTGEVL